MPATDESARHGAASIAGTPLRLALLAALLLFLFFGREPEHTRLWMAIFQAGHAPLFGVVALLVRSVLATRTGRSAARVSLIAFGVTLVAGAATEVLQGLQPHGDPSVEDLLRDACGAAAFLLPGAVAGRRRAIRLAAATAAVVLLAAAGVDLARTVAMYRHRDRALPTLYAMDGSWWERERISGGSSRIVPNGAPPALAAQAGFPLARVELGSGVYPGVTFDEPYPDWRAYRRLVLTIASDLDAPLEMTVRVHDAAHDQRFADRFNRRLVVAPGVNRFAIAIEDIRSAPDRREMDMTRVRGIVLFAYRLTQPTRVYVGPIRLE